VTAPPELISTNFETVALMLTVPDVDCPKHATAEITNKMVNRLELKMILVVWRGTGLVLEEEWIWISGRQQTKTDGRHHIESKGARIF
jgi:hypothetical protein